MSNAKPMDGMRRMEVYNAQWTDVPHMWIMSPRQHRRWRKKERAQLGRPMERSYEDYGKWCSGKNRPTPRRRKRSQHG